MILNVLSVTMFYCFMLFLHVFSHLLVLSNIGTYRATSQKQELIEHKLNYFTLQVVYFSFQVCHTGI